MGTTLRRDVGTIDLLRAIDGAVSGDDRAITDLVRHCLPAITNYLAARDAEHPEALANQVVAEIVCRLPDLDFTAREQFWSYLYSVAKSRLVDEKRVAKPSLAAHPIDELDSQVNGFADEVVDRQWLSDLMTGLTAEQRQVIQLRYHEDLTLSETANRTGKSVNAIKSLQRRAITALAAAAATAVAIALVALGLRIFGAATVNVQSLEPAGDSSEIGLSELSPLPDLVLASPNFDQLLSTAELHQQDPIPPSNDSTNRSVPWVGQPQTDQNQTEAPQRTAALDGSDPLTPTTGPPGQPNDGADVASGTSVLLGMPAAGPTASTTAPPTPVAPVNLAIADAAAFDLMSAKAMWLDIDVLGNDSPAVAAPSLRITRQPSTGLVEVVDTDAGKRIRYHPTTAGDFTAFYEVCTDAGCATAPVTLSTSWYAEAICTLVEPTIIGTPGDDVLTGTAGTDVIYGLEGNDTIDGGGGLDLLCGGPGDDTITGGDASDVILGGAGLDHLTGEAGDDLILGDDGGDFIDGGAGNDTLFGGDGSDSIFGGGDQDSLYGELGGDMLIGGSGDDRIFGGQGIDVIDGNAGADLLHGGADGDDLSSDDDGQPDRLFGGPGTDTLSTDDAADAIDGQGDVDLCWASVPVINCEAGS